MKKNLRYAWPLHAVLWLTNCLPDNVVFLRLRGFLASFFFKKCGRDLRLGRDITFYDSSNITIGNNVYIARGNWFSAGGSITIGDEVIFGPLSVIAAANHTKADGSYRYGPPVCKPIVIGRGSWIAGNCTITAGSVIGEGSLIAANSVVSRVVPDGVMYGGIPGRIIKEV